MEVSQVTRLRHSSKVLANGDNYIFAWSALSVTMVILSEDAKTELHVEMSEVELRAALAKIEARKEEIKHLMSKEN